MTPEEKAALEAENAALRAELAAQKHNRLHEANAAFAEKLTAEGRLLPAYKDLAVATLDHFATLEQVVEFGEGDAKKPLAEQLKAMLAAAPQVVSFGEHATTARAAVGGNGAGVHYAEGTPSESIDLDQRIRSYAAAHKLSYAEAAQCVAH